MTCFCNKGNCWEYVRNKEDLRNLKKPKKTALAQKRGGDINKRITFKRNRIYFDMKGGQNCNRSKILVFKEGRSCKRTVKKRIKGLIEGLF